MTVRVKYFASLRELTGRDSDEIEAAPTMTVADVWGSLMKDVEMPTNTLMAVNMEYTDAGHHIHDGDEIAFFPPVTGG